MTNPLRMPRLVALGLVAAAVAVAVVAPVATAQTPTDDCPGPGTSVVTGNIDNPDEGQVLQTTTTTVTGCFEYGSDIAGPLGTISKVTVSLVAGRGQVLPGGSTATVFEGATRAYRLSWPTPNLGWNGPYTARVVIEGSARPPGGRQSNVTAERRFFIEAAPAPPAKVKAEAVGDEGVTVTWEKNKEPDIVLYEVHRAPKGGDFIAVAQTAGNLTTLNDRPSVGEWRYVVIAIRRGAGDDGIASGPSNEAEAAVVVPPVPATTTTAPGGGGGGGDGSPPPTTTQKTGSGIVITSGTTGGGGSARPAGGGKVDLSRFGTLNRSTTRQIDAPDPGFDETLPFTPGDQPAVPVEDETQELGADDPNNDRAIGQDLISEDSERRRSLTFVAFGLLLFVMSMGGLWMRGEVKRADELEALEPAPAPPPGTGPPAPRGPTRPGPPLGPPGLGAAPAPAAARPDRLYAPPSPPTRATQVPAPPSPPRQRHVAEASPVPSPARPSTAASPAPTTVPEGRPAPEGRDDRAARRAARRPPRQADPLAGMAPMSPPPPRPWSARQPLDAPGLDIPDPEPAAAPPAERTPRRARRSERSLPVR